VRNAYCASKPSNVWKRCAKSPTLRRAMEGGRRLLDERQVFNIRAAGWSNGFVTTTCPSGCSGTTPCRSTCAAYEPGGSLHLHGGQAFDYETNLSPDDRGSAQPLLTESLLAPARHDAGRRAMIGGGSLAAALGHLARQLECALRPDELQQRSIRAGTDLAAPGTVPHPSWHQQRCSLAANSHAVSRGRFVAVPEFRRYCRPPAPRSAGPMPGLVIPFGTKSSWPNVSAGRSAGRSRLRPVVFATKIQSAAVYFTNYQTAYLAATRAFTWCRPAGCDDHLHQRELETRRVDIVDQAIPCRIRPAPTTLADPAWIPAFDGSSERSARSAALQLPGKGYHGI